MIFPLANGPHGGSIISLVAAFIVSFHNMIFIISLTIFMSYFIAKKVFKIENVSKKNTLLKIFLTIFYAAAPLFIGLIFSFVEKFFGQNYGLGDSFFLINSLLSFIPFPFSGSIVYGISLFPLDKIYLNQVWPIFFGFAFSFVMVILFFRKSLHLLVSVIKDVNVDIKEEKNSKREIPSIFITIRTPLKAIFKKDIIFIIRDFSLMGSVIMPITSVIMYFLTLGNIGAIGANSIISNVIKILFFTQGISFLIFGLTSAENISRELTLMLPIKQHDIYKEKRLIMWLMLFLAQLIIFIVLLFQNSNLLFLDITSIFPILLNFCYEAIIIVFFSDYVLTLYALFFGKIWNNYSIQMQNSNKKALKGIIIVLSIFVLKIILSFFDIYLRIGIAIFFSILMRVVAHKILS